MSHKGTPSAFIPLRPADFGGRVRLSSLASAKEEGQMAVDLPFTPIPSIPFLRLAVRLIPFIPLRPMGFGGQVRVHPCSLASGFC